jgi:hypothetical protein
MKETAMDRFPPAHPVLYTSCIWHPDSNVPREGYAVVLFRRKFTLPKAARNVRLWVSASQRFILHLDGKIIARGPSRSDPERWNCPAVDVGVLSAGRHVLAATVFHMGSHAGKAQLGGPGFFLLHAEGMDLSRRLDTGTGWKCFHDVSRTPVVKHCWAKKTPHDVVGSGERVDAKKYPWGWERIGFVDKDWPQAWIVCRAARDDWGNRPLGHVLRPDPLPPMEERSQRFTRVVEAPEGLRDRLTRWLEGPGRVVVPSRTHWRIVLDLGAVTNAYPLLKVSGGKGSHIRMVSAEAPYLDSTYAKGDRDKTDGANIWGHRDDFHPDGGRHRTFTTLWFRSFRYVELVIQTAENPLSLESFETLFTGFPLSSTERFVPDARHRNSCARMLDISWRTARLCAHETFFDCPHFEQAQFEGDSRVQAVFHYLLAGEDRLARKAIDDFHASRTEEGLLLSHFPARTPQVIATFSLFWIGMLHDFRVYRGDAAFLRRYMPCAREILAWFDFHTRADGLLGFIAHAPFMDWTGDFKCGNAPQDTDGGSSILTLLFASACGWMAELENVCGYPELTNRWRRMHRRLVKTTMNSCWDARRGLLADTPLKRTFSVHAQVQAILVGALRSSHARKVLRRAIDATGVTQVGTLYYRYYVAQAMKACGWREGFFDLLRSWETLLEGTGLTTWPESDKNPRSDCHAWSVTPAIEFLQTILGIEPDPRSHGFSSMQFHPTLGPLSEASGTVPTPHGDVRVKIRRDGIRGVDVELYTPVPAVVAGGERFLPPGKHRLHLAH